MSESSTKRRISSPLKWHGGDYYQAAWKLSHFPAIGSYTHYVSTCVGGANLELAMPPERYEGVSEVVNDLDGELTNFWSVLRSTVWFDKFKHEVEAMPFSKSLFEECVMDEGLGDQVYRAAAFFVRNRQSRQGLMEDFATLSRSRTRRGMNEQVSSWLTAIDGLPEVHERIKRFVILNENMIDVIRREDSPKTFFYIDPPYWPETRVARNAYRFEASQRFHAILTALLSRLDEKVAIDFAAGWAEKHWDDLSGEEPIEDYLEVLDFQLQGRFMLCGYECPHYINAAHHQGWQVVRKEYANSASSKKSKEKKTECIWMNYRKDAV